MTFYLLYFVLQVFNCDDLYGPLLMALFMYYKYEKHGLVDLTLLIVVFSYCFYIVYQSSVLSCKYVYVN